MLGLESASAQYLSEHPGQAFCLECLSTLASASSEPPEKKCDPLEVSFREFQGTCFGCHEFCRVFCFGPKAGLSKSEMA
jgi:hypothetical protein